MLVLKVCIPTPCFCQFLIQASQTCLLSGKIHCVNNRNREPNMLRLNSDHPLDPSQYLPSVSTQDHLLYSHCSLPLTPHTGSVAQIQPQNPAVACSWLFTESCRAYELTLSRASSSLWPDSLICPSPLCLAYLCLFFPSPAFQTNKHVPPFESLHIAYSVLPEVLWVSILMLQMYPQYSVKIVSK